MARSYHVAANCTNTQNTTAAMIHIQATAATQPSVYEINSGSDATPANQAVKYNFTKYTAGGVAQGSITPSQINGVAGTAIASLFTSFQGMGQLGTFSGIQLQWAQNQNTAYRWVASSPQRMIMLPSTASAGGGILATVVTSAFNAVFGIFVEE